MMPWEKIIDFRRIWRERGGWRKQMIFDFRRIWRERGGWRKEMIFDFRRIWRERGGWRKGSREAGRISTMKCGIEK